MFDIHKVKPAHGWREFVGEVGIIVLGVMIALSAEALAERWRWHEQLEQSRTAMKAELFDAAINAEERLVVAPCLRARLIDLGNRLQRSSGAWIGSPMYRHSLHDDESESYVVAPAYAPPSRDHLTDAWKNVLSSGTFNHLSDEEGSAYSLLFDSIEELDKFQSDEAIAAARLSPLSYSRTLSDRDRADALATVAEVDRASTLINLVSFQMLKELRELPIEFDRTKLAQRERRMLVQQRTYRGDCVSTKLIDLT